MNGAVFTGPNNLTVTTVPLPNGTIKARVKACAICGYDVRIFRNGHRKVRPPVILGHEICAELVDTVGTMNSGSRVAIYPQVPCLECKPCKRDQYNLCMNLKELGSTINGGFAEYVEIPHNIVKIGGLVPVPSGLSNEQAALLEPLACCLNSVSRTIARIAGEPRIVIIGDGPIGLMHLQLFRQVPQTRICLVGRIESRMRKASDLGAHRVIKFSGSESTGQDILGELAAGADAIVIATSNPEALKVAETVAGRNSLINLFAGMPQGHLLHLDANRLHYDQISVLGSFGTTPVLMAKAAEIVASGKINLETLITHRYELSQIGRAFADTENYAGLRGVVDRF